MGIMTVAAACDLLPFDRTSPLPFESELRETDLGGADFSSATL
jgi:hypothetical protein